MRNWLAIACFLVAAMLVGNGIGHALWAEGPTMQQPRAPHEQVRIIEAGFNVAPVLAGTTTVLQSTGTPGAKPEMTTRWKWEYGGVLLDKHYTTEKGNGESSSTHSKRHLRGLLEMLKTFPPASQSP